MYIVYLAVLLFIWRYLAWSPRPLVGVSRKSPLLVGHRGVRELKPENTVEAFRFAFDSGLDGIECDVQKLKDGTLILYHDFKMNDTKLTDMTLEQVKACKEPYALLSVLLDIAKDYKGTLLNIEFKTASFQTNNLERDVLKAVKEAALEDRVIYSSFNPFSLLYLRLNSPSARLGLLYSPDMSSFLRNGFLAGWLHVDAIHPHESQVSLELIAYAKKKALVINTWTVNDPMRISWLYKQELNAIMADNPQNLLEASGKAVTNQYEEVEKRESENKIN